MLVKAGILTLKPYTLSRLDLGNLLEYDALLRMLYYHPVKDDGRQYVATLTIPICATSELSEYSNMFIFIDPNNQVKRWTRLILSRSQHY